MSRTLLENWTDYRAATTQLLRLAQRSLCIHDLDLSLLQPDSREHVDILSDFLVAPVASLRIALHQGEHLQNHCPRLQRLLTTWGHRAAVRKVPEGLTSDRECLIVADDCHALHLSERRFARGALLIDEPELVAMQIKRFEAIWHECRENLLGTPLGL